MTLKNIFRFVEGPEQGRGVQDEKKPAPGGAGCHFDFRIIRSSIMPYDLGR